MNLIVCLLVFIIGLLILLLNTLLFTFLKNKTKPLQMLSYYLLASTIEGLVCFSFGVVFPINNFFLSHIFFTIQLVFLGLFFYHLFDNKNQRKYVKISSIAVFLVSGFQYVIKPSTFWQFSLIEIVGVSSLLISFGLLYVYNTLGQNKDYFYFCLGMIMFFLCSCIVYLFGNLTLVFIEDPYMDHWIIKDAFFIVYQLLILKEYKNINKSSFVRE